MKHLILFLTLTFTLSITATAQQTFVTVGTPSTGFMTHDDPGSYISGSVGYYFSDTNIFPMLSFGFIRNLDLNYDNEWPKSLENYTIELNEPFMSYGIDISMYHKELVPQFSLFYGFGAYLQQNVNVARSKLTGDVYKQSGSNKVIPAHGFGFDHTIREGSVIETLGAEYHSERGFSLRVSFGI